MIHQRDQPRNRGSVIAISLLVLISIKVTTILARGPMALELDAIEYWNLSSQVLTGDIWLIDEPIAYRTPIYPWFLAAIRVFTGPWALMTIVIVQGCMIVATSWLASFLAVIFTQNESARIWTLLASLATVSSIPFGQAILSEVIFAFLLTLHLYLQAVYIEKPTMVRAIWTALSLAVCILIRPIAILLWVVDAIWLLKSGRKVWSQWFAMAAVLFLALLPWASRNAALFGKLSLTEFMGRNLWVVTFQEQAGAGLNLPPENVSKDFSERVTDLRANDEWRNTWSVSTALVASGLNDAQADRVMLSICIGAISEHPALFADRMFRRIINFWRCVSTHIPHPTSDPKLLDHQIGWNHPNAIVESIIENRWSLSVFTNTVIAGWTAISILALIFRKATRWWGLWAGLVLVYFSVVTGCFEIPAYRYRMVIEPLMMSVLGAGLSRIFDTSR